MAAPSDAESSKRTRAGLQNRLERMLTKALGRELGAFYVSLAVKGPGAMVDRS